MKLQWFIIYVIVQAAHSVQPHLNRLYFNFLCGNVIACRCIKYEFAQHYCVFLRCKINVKVLKSFPFFRSIRDLQSIENYINAECISACFDDESMASSAFPEEPHEEIDWIYSWSNTEDFFSQLELCRCDFFLCTA